MATIKVKRDKATKQAVRRYCLTHAYRAIDGPEKSDEEKARYVYAMAIGTSGCNVSFNKYVQIFARWLRDYHLSIARYPDEVELLVKQWGGSTEDIDINDLVGEWYFFIAKQWCKILQEFGLID